MGGLGNQMFQYAAGFRLAQRHRTKLSLDLTFLLDRTPRENFTFREFDLGIFSIHGPVASPAEIRRLRRTPDQPCTLRERLMDRLRPHYFHSEQHPRFDPAVLDLPDDTYLQGYFQDERYFADVAPLVVDKFRLRPEAALLPTATRELGARIQGTPNAVCVNIRRGDYVSNPVANRHHGVCDIRYFERALQWLEARGQRGTIFVFSDDIDWCREYFGGARDAVLVTHEHAGPRFSTYLWLMTLCRHFIIPNSSFGWWAAWLGSHPDKVVLRPSRWIQAPELNDVDICPASWVKIDNA